VDGLHASAIYSEIARTKSGGLWGTPWVIPRRLRFIETPSAETVFTHFSDVRGEAVFWEDLPLRRKQERLSWLIDASSSRH
jgi:hypothetical protein